MKRNPRSGIVMVATLLLLATPLSPLVNECHAQSEATEAEPTPYPITGVGPTGTLSEEEAAMVKRFLVYWSKRKDALFGNTFMGVSTWQNPLDVWVTQEILYEVRPDFVVEAGTHRGGSALLWAMFLQHMNPGAHVITIDIEDKRPPKQKFNPLARHVTFLLGSSTSPKIVAKVKQQVAGKKVVVILDSLHTEEHVAQELEAYASIVPVGSYIIVQDTLAGAIRATQKFVDRNDDWEFDRHRERLLLSNNIRGFLKRVR